MPGNQRSDGFAAGIQQYTGLPEAGYTDAADTTRRAVAQCFRDRRLGSVQESHRVEFRTGRRERPRRGRASRRDRIASLGEHDRLAGLGPDIETDEEHVPHLSSLGFVALSTWIMMDIVVFRW